LRHGFEQRTATVSVLFCDLVASTERQQALGDDAADEFRRVVFAAMNAAADGTHGDVVKTTGDGMMIVFRDSAVDAVTCATRLHEGVEALAVVPPARLRVGVSAGEAATEDNDWYGTPVVEAARLCAAADVGVTLVTDVVRVLVGSRGGHRFRSDGSVMLKGIAAPVAVATVAHEQPATPVSHRAIATRAGRRRRWPVIVALPAIVAITVGAMAFTPRGTRAKPPLPTVATYTPRVETTTCSSTVQAVVADAACGFLVVPENRERLDGRWIRVRFTRYPARHPSTAAEPVLELATALDNAEIVDDPTSSPVRDDADLIVMGGRGLGSSVPTLTCPEFAAFGPEILRHPENDAATITQGQTALRACHDRLVRAGIHLDHYTVIDEADDVVDLIRALHLRQANLQAVWDAARVALAVARDAPEVVRSMFLLDPEVPRSSFMADPVSSLGAAFDRYAALCSADPSCRAAYPNLAQVFRDDVARQADHPQIVIPTDVISGSLRVAVAQPPVFVDGDRLAQGLAAAFTSSLRNMPLIAAGIAHPNPTLNASLALAQNFPLVLKDFAWGGFLSRVCSYEIHTRSVGAAVAAATRPEFAGYDDPAFRWTCAAWNVPEVQQAAFAPVSSDTPTLVVEQQLDPRWQPDTAVRLRAGLTNVSVLSFATLPGGAVAGDFPTCYNDLRRAFVRDPSRTLDTAACARRTPRIDFVVPTT
jgi:class 3 adenylate cyclase/pimeloyl-ACP methyl ester carboxylesterase